jgi:hypothetical protein
VQQFLRFVRSGAAVPLVPVRRKDVNVQKTVGAFVADAGQPHRFLCAANGVKFIIVLRYGLIKLRIGIRRVDLRQKIRCLFGTAKGNGIKNSIVLYGKNLSL